MKKLYIILGLMVSCLASAQIDKESDTLEIWTLFSVGNFVNQNAERIIEKDWPFKVIGIAGDAFPEDLIDSVEIHNAEIWNYLDSNGYTDSKTEFQSDLLAEIKRIGTAVKILESNKVISDLYADLRKRNLQNFTELNKKREDLYEFSVYSFDMENLEKGQVFEMKFLVDLKNEVAKINE